ncbi:MAG: HAMP domain-containing histidine kinase [Sphingomonadaceae bacterium]|nr:HAMP domain-containing histidine kinase [Sphingomonadaceae bacterium]
MTDRAVADAEYRTSVADVRQALVELESRSPSMGALAPIDEIDRRIDAQSADRKNSMVYAIRRTGGTIITGNIQAWPASAPAGKIGEFHLAVGQEEMVGTVRPFGGDFEMLVGRRLVTLEGVRQRLMLIFALALGIALSAVTWLFVRQRARTDQILADFSQGLQTASSGGFYKRLDVPDDPDFANVANRVNLLLDRVETSTQSLRHLSANIAHELCQPLAGAIADCERIAATGGPVAETGQRLLGRLEAMDETFRGLLSLTRIESGIDDAGAFETFDLATTACEVRQLFLDYASTRNVELGLELQPCTLFGSPGLVRSAIGNLLSNAIRFSPEGGTVTISVRSGLNACHLCVRDQGPGFDGQLPLRANGQQSEMQRHGLGLRLVRAIALRHNARLEFPESDQGLMVCLTFPSDL